MAYSTIPAVVDRLLVVLAARAGLAGVLIADGLPVELPTESERVFVDDPTGVSREWAQLGGTFRIDESYSIKVAVETYMPGSDRAACRHRLYELIAEVEQAAVLDAPLAALLMQAVKPGAMDPKVLPTDDGWLGSAMLQLDCEARITAS